MFTNAELVAIQVSIEMRIDFVKDQMKDVDSLWEKPFDQNAEQLYSNWYNRLIALESAKEKFDALVKSQWKIQEDHLV